MNAAAPGFLEVDARGLFCPLPVLRLAAALASRPVGALARLTATDPASLEDVDAYCRETGAALLSRTRVAEVIVFEVEKRALSKEVSG